MPAVRRESVGLGRGREAERIGARRERFVLVRGGDGSGSIQAFAHFRFDVNDEGACTLDSGLDEA